MCEACCMSSQSHYKFWVIKSVPEAKLSIQPGLMLVFLIYMKWLGVWLFPPIPEWMAGPSQDNNPAFDQASLTISLVPIYAPWWRVALWEDSFFVQECNTLTWPCHKYGPCAWSPVVSLNILDNCNTPVQSLFFSIAWFKLVHGLLLV